MEFETWKLRKRRAVDETEPLPGLVDQQGLKLTKSLRRMMVGYSSLHSLGHSKGFHLPEYDLYFVGSHPGDGAGMLLLPQLAV